jgi:hypothetical protein
LEYLDHEIANLPENMKRLEEKRASLLSYRVRNNAILSPLRWIPPELLREIFSWTLPLLEGAAEVTLGIEQTPWMLTRISSRWRAVTFSTPSLWSHIFIDYRHSHINRDPSTYSPSLIKAQLDYAQKVKIHFYGSQGIDLRPQIDMFKLLSQHSSRWEEFSVELTAEMLPILMTLRDRIPSLRRLWIQWSTVEDQTGVHSIDCFQTASSLVDVGIFSEYRFVPVLFPVHQLTRYDIDCQLEEHIRVLKQAPNVIEARIGIDFDEEDWSDSLETVDLLRLRRLYISPAGALKYFKVPALEELALDIYREDILSLVRSLLDRSSCFLRRLCLQSPTAHTAIEYLQCCPSLTELLILHDDGSPRDEINALISALTLPNYPGGLALAPQLHLISFGCDYESHLDYEAYLEMLQSRRGAENCALKSAALLIVDGLKPESETVRSLHTLRQEGLDFLLLEGVRARDEMLPWDSTLWT